MMRLMFQQVTGAVIDMNLGIQALLQLTLQAVFIPSRLRYGFEKDIKGQGFLVLYPGTWKHNDKKEQTIQ